MKRKWIISAALSLTMLGTATAVMAGFGEDREATMKEVGKAMKALAEIAKGAPYDAAIVEQNTTAMAAAFEKFGTLFPAGSETASKASSADIWANMDDFNTLRTNAKDAALKVQTSGPDGFKAAFGELAGTCKACHTKYRLAD
jgi:cytochrome c556